MASPSVRRLTDRAVFVLCLLCVVLASVPLASILWTVVSNGISALSFEFLTSPQGVIGQPGGGIGPAIEGTFILVGLSCLVGVPIGVLSGVYLSEYGNNRLGQTLRLFNDVLAEFPSIVVGILAYSLIVVTIGSFSTIAGVVALSIIMLPIVARTTEESIKVVPTNLRDAAMALGIKRWRTTISVVLSTGRGGIITGVLLSVARIAGETAPLILTVLGSQLFFAGLGKPVDALPLRIWRLSLLPYTYARAQGWGAALVLILIVLGINLVVRLASRGRYGLERSNM